MYLMCKVRWIQFAIPVTDTDKPQDFWELLPQEARIIDSDRAYISFETGGSPFQIATSPGNAGVWKALQDGPLFGAPVPVCKGSPLFLRRLTTTTAGTLQLIVSYGAVLQED